MQRELGIRIIGTTDNTLSIPSVTPKNKHDPKHDNKQQTGTALRVLGMVYQTLLREPGAAAAALDGEQVCVSLCV